MLAIELSDLSRLVRNSRRRSTISDNDDGTFSQNDADDISRLRQAAEDFVNSLDSPGNEPLPSGLPSDQLRQLVKTLITLTSLNASADKQVLAYANAKLREVRTILRDGPEMVYRTYNILFGEIDNALASLTPKDLAQLLPPADSKSRIIQSETVRAEIDAQLAYLDDLERKSEQTIVIIDQRITIDQTKNYEIALIRTTLDALIKNTLNVKTELGATLFDLRWFNRLIEESIKLVGQLSNLAKSASAVVRKYNLLKDSLYLVKRAGTRVTKGAKQLLSAIRNKEENNQRSMPMPFDEGSFKQLRRDCSLLEVGGFHPTNQISSSFFGDVKLGAPGETWPTWGGAPLWPLCQLNLENSPVRHPILKDVALLTFFVGKGFEGQSQELLTNAGKGMGAFWCLRTYHSIDGLIEIEAPQHGSPLKTLEARWQDPIDDYPTEDMLSDEMPEHMKRVYDNFYWAAHSAGGTEDGCKLGGWPEVIQTPPWWEYQNKHDALKLEYVLQIGSVRQADWMWGDVGCAYLARSSISPDTWALDWQCY